MVKNKEMKLQKEKLMARLAYFEDSFDYRSSVDSCKEELFLKAMGANTKVNISVQDFLGKQDESKKYFIKRDLNKQYN